MTKISLKVIAGCLSCLFSLMLFSVAVAQEQQFKFPIPEEFTSKYRSKSATRQRKEDLEAASRHLSQWHRSVQRKETEPTMPLEIRASLGYIKIYRAPESIDQLLSLIEFRRDDLGVRSNEDRGDFYPAAGALVAIGNPVLEPAIQQLWGSSDGSTTRRKNLCWVIGKIDSPRVGRLRIEDRIQELQSPPANSLYLKASKEERERYVKNLQTALNLYNEIFPTDLSPYSPPNLPLWDKDNP